MPANSVVGFLRCSTLVGFRLPQLCFSILPPAAARPASLLLPLQVPGQGLLCGAGCWFPEGVYNPAPLPPQNLLGHWSLSRSLPLIFVSDLFRSSDVEDVHVTQAGGDKYMEEKVPKSNVTDICENEKNCAGIEQSTASTENTSPESENPTSDSKPTAEEENSSPVESAAVSATDDYNGNNDGERTVDESTENCEETETQKGATGTEARDAWSPPASEEIEDTQKMEGNLHSEDEKNYEDQKKYRNKERGQSEDSLEHGNRQKRFENQGCRPKHRPGIQRPYGGNGEERTKEKKKPNKNSQKGENWDEGPKESKEKTKESKEKTKKEKKNRSERFNDSDLPDERGQYEYFWRSHSVYSQWYACEFEVEGKQYNCAEQYMMHQKAVLMEDGESAEIIMALDEPREMKQQGRYVKNFNQDLWNNSCKDVVKRGNMAKFSQNEKLKEILFSTYPKTLVEASPMDQIWGIGLAKDDRRAWNKQTWRGQNLLGEILTEVRDSLIEQEGIMDPVVSKAEHGD